MDAWQYREGLKADFSKALNSICSVRVCGGNLGGCHPPQPCKRAGLGAQVRPPAPAFVLKPTFHNVSKQNQLLAGMIKITTFSGW